MASKAIGFLNFKFGADLGGFDRAMKKAQKNLKKFGKSVERTGKKLTSSLTLPIIAVGAGATKVFMDFEQAMLKVEAVSGATTEKMEMLTETAKRLGATTMFSASQVAELQLNLSKLGLTPDEIDKATESILRLSQATGEDLGETATVVASTMRAFGLTAEDTQRITDVMADSFSSTALDLSKFSTAMATLAPVAKESGVEIEQASALVGVLANNGVDASTAGTALRNIFLDLAKEGMSLDQALAAINNSTDPLTAAFDMFGKRGATVATILSKNQEEIQKLTQDFIDSEDEAASMADTMDRGLAGAMRKLKSQTEAAGIELGEVLAPTVNKLAGFVGSLMDKFSGLSDTTKKIIVIVGGLVAAIGPALIVIGKMATGVAALGPVLKAIGVLIMRTLIPAFQRLFVVMMANPILATIGLLAGLTAAIYSYVSSSDDAAQSVKDQADEERKLNAELREKEDNMKKLKALDFETSITELKIKGASDAEIQLKAVNFQLDQINESLRKAREEGEEEKFILRQQKSLLEQKVKLEKKIQKEREKQFGGGGGGTNTKKNIEAVSLAPITPQIELASVDPQFSLAPAFDIPETIFEKIDRLMGKTSELITLGTYSGQVWKESMQALGNELAGGAESMSEFGNVVKGVLKDTIGGLISKGVAAAVSNALSNPAISINPALIPVVAGVAAGLARTAFNSLIPEFAKGGLVTGPTLGLIGEGIGTTASNPEVIAPLDKLKQFIGGGSQNVVVEGVIKGNDIFLSNRNTGYNRQRSV